MAARRLPLTIEQILERADAYRRRTGRWPTLEAGPLAGSAGRTWRSINKSLRRSYLKGGGYPSLSQLLAKRRGKRNVKDLPRLRITHILDWADRHRRRSGRWPVHGSGPVTGAPGETWANIDAALRVGNRGLPGGSSLARLLAKHRHVPNRLEKKPRLTRTQILLWADRHRRRTGSWPTKVSGVITRSGGESWIGIDEALLHGRRGLPGGTTLVQVLARHRGRPYRRKGPDLHVRDILEWARAHRERTGKWPTQGSGPVRGVRGERWGNIQSSLYKGSRGLPPGSSLAKLFAKHFG
jgi:hypothetical protein